MEFFFGLFFLFSFSTGLKHFCSCTGLVQRKWVTEVDLCSFGLWLNCKPFSLLRSTSDIHLSKVYKESWNRWQGYCSTKGSRNLKIIFMPHRWWSQKYQKGHSLSIEPCRGDLQYIWNGRAELDTRQVVFLVRSHCFGRAQKKFGYLYQQDPERCAGQRGKGKSVTHWEPKRQKSCPREDRLDVGLVLGPVNHALISLEFGYR